MYTGELVQLRAYDEKDTKQAQLYMNDPEVKWLLQNNVPFPFTMADEKKFIDGQSAFKDDYTFAIDTLDGEYIGGCGLNKVDWKNRVATVGIVIGKKDYWGKGYGTDAMKLLISFIFDEMNMNKVQLHVYSYNERAIKSYKKSGFIEEGRLRQAQYNRGQYHDEVIMGLLRDDYRNK